MTSCSDSKKNNFDNDEDSTSLLDQQINSIDNDGEDFPLYVSIIKLIANPDEYHGKKIRIYGVGNIEFEGTAVYLCIDNWYYFVSKNAIWVSMEGEIVDNELWYYINGERISYEDAKKYNGKYVLIEGTFDMYETGHRDRYSGGIYNVTRFLDISNSNRGIDMSDYGEYIGNSDDWIEGE